MYALIYWGERTTSVVSEKCLKYDNDGNARASLDGSTYYSTRVLLKSHNKSYLEKLLVTKDGLAVYSAKRHSLVWSLSSGYNKDFNMSEIIPSTKSDLPSEGSWSTGSFSDSNCSTPPLRYVFTKPWPNSSGSNDDDHSNVEIFNDPIIVDDTRKYDYVNQPDVTLTCQPIIQLDTKTIETTEQVSNTSQTELIPNSGIYVRTTKLETCRQKYHDHSYKLAQSLMRAVVGKKILRNMSASEHEMYERIPTDAYDAVKHYVRWNGTPKMTSVEFQITMTFLCRKLRYLERKKNK